MTRFFGFIVGAIWLAFVFMAFQARAAGVAAGQEEVVFWWTITTLAYLAAAVAAVVGNLRHKASGPKKPAPARAARKA